MTVTAVPLTSESVPAPPPLHQPDWRVVGAALVLLLGGAAALFGAFAWREAALYLLGTALGLVLYHATFGFASSWRHFVADGRGAGLRAGTDRPDRGDASPC